MSSVEDHITSLEDNFNFCNVNDILKKSITGKVVYRDISRLTAPGDNYGSLMMKVDITVTNEDDEEEIIHYVAKCVPPNKKMQAIFNIPITFKNEIGWYTTVIPSVIEFQKSEGVKKLADFFMKIYGARLSFDPDSEEVDDDGLILCENLAVQGYVNADRRIGFDLDQSKVILKKLATFHALTLGLRIKKPEVFNQKVKKYLHTLENDKGKLNAFEPTLNFLKGHPETSHLVPRVQESFKLMGSEIKVPEIREPWGCAVHTDFWVNNIMLKDEGKGIPPKVIILDFQTCGYGSPIDDLLFFLGSSVQTHLAEKHFDELLKLYYIELMENLKVLNVDTNLFPYGSFQKELELQAPAQFAHCMFFVGIIMAERGKGIDPTAKDFNPEQGLLAMFENITDNHREKYIFLTKEYAKRNWI